MTKRAKLIEALASRISSLTINLDLVDLVEGEGDELHFLNDAVDLINILGVAVGDKDPKAGKAMEMVQSLDTEPRDVIHDMLEI